MDIGNETVLTSVTIINGFVKSNELWKKNGRVKTFRLSISDKPFAFFNVRRFTRLRNIRFGKYLSA
ncbi:MAG: hypothetical protein U5K54_29510 [Cytophagales bacterium]|nr:hypothetical protein [Cytophagales bacterium]